MKTVLCTMLAIGVCTGGGLVTQQPMVGVLMLAAWIMGHFCAVWIDENER